MDCATRDRVAARFQLTFAIMFHIGNTKKPLLLREAVFWLMLICLRIVIRLNRQTGYAGKGRSRFRSCADVVHLLIFPDGGLVVHGHADFVQSLQQELATVLIQNE